jgi:hypothetical protein
VRRLLGSTIAGLGATLLMEYASQAFYDRKDDASRAREEQLRLEMPTTALVRKLARAIGAELGDERAERLGMAAHYGFGAAGGPAALALSATGRDRLRAALLVAAAMELAVDQAANTALGLTAPSWRFPAVTHVRAMAAHAVYGLALGLMLSTGEQK